MRGIEEGFSRRALVRGGLLGAAGLTLGPAFWRDALAAAPTTPGPGPYGALSAADANGLMLPPGFRSRVIARGLTPVEGTTYPWHLFSDGAATYPTEEGGWILVSNSEVPLPGAGGASAIRFRPDGSVEDAYRILFGTQTNCAGGPTPWGTWLSCEEHDQGTVWECDPLGSNLARERPALGVFSHEAACVDPGDGRVYLTEDVGDAGFYRFTPREPRDLSAGLLEIAAVGTDGAVTWRPVPDPSASRTPTRQQVPGAARYRRGEGIWFDSGIVYMATTSDDRIHAYDTATRKIDVLYDGKALGAAAPLHAVDNVTVAERSGDLFVCEDGDDLDICIITPEREVARFLKLTGAVHSASELTGVVFDPAGRRMYFASQRSFGIGLVYEVTGPFRQTRPQQLKLEVDVARRPSIASLRRGALPVSVRVSAPAKVDIVLKTQVSPGAGARGAAGKRKSLTIAKRSRSFKAAGRRRLRLRGRDKARRRLSSRRAVSATLTVSARDARNRRAKIERRIRFR